MASLKFVNSSHTKLFTLIFLRVTRANGSSCHVENRNRSRGPRRCREDNRRFVTDEDPSEESNMVIAEYPLRYPRRPPTGSRVAHRNPIFSSITEQDYAIPFGGWGPEGRQGERRVPSGLIYVFIASWSGTWESECPHHSGVWCPAPRSSPSSPSPVAISNPRISNNSCREKVMSVM